MKKLDFTADELREEMFERGREIAQRQKKNSRPHS